MKIVSYYSHLVGWWSFLLHANAQIYEGFKYQQKFKSIFYLFLFFSQLTVYLSFYCLFYFKSNFAFCFVLCIVISIFFLNFHLKRHKAWRIWKGCKLRKYQKYSLYSPDCYREKAIIWITFTYPSPQQKEYIQFLKQNLKANHSRNK